MIKKTLLVLLVLALPISIIVNIKNQANSNEIYKTYPYGITDFTPPTLTKLDPQDTFSRHRPRTRVWQGIPQIEVADNGRLWVAWTASSFQGEKSPHFPDMYSVIATSTDDGETWKEVFVYNPYALLEGGSSEPMLWKDKNGKIRLTVSRVMFVDTDKSKNISPTTTWEWTMQNANNEDPKWSEPKFITKYNASIMKPTYLKNGTLIRQMDDFCNKQDPDRIRFIAYDGETEEELFSSSAKVENANFAEQMVLERKDGSLFSFVRANLKGQKFITSNDGGRSWKDEGYFPQEFSIDTKCVLHRLPTGEVLLVANDVQKDPETGKFIPEGAGPRCYMSAFLSLDDAKTFSHKILLDERNTSYPSVSLAKDGYIYVAYDYGRYKPGAQELVFAKITVDDIKAGKIVNKGSKLKQVISNLEKQGGGAKKGDKL